MNIYTRTDGRSLRVVPGFRDRVLGAQQRVTPRSDWTEAQYETAAARKRRRAARLIGEISRHRGSLTGAAVLDVACGDGVNCLCLGREPVERVVGIDLELPLLDSGEKGVQTRRLAARALLDRDAGLDHALDRLPVRLLVMDATKMTFSDDSFDVLLTRSALEHLAPIEQALAEMARVVRPGGLVYHRVDPYFWVRGCHKRGLVDIPWAHARLSLADFRRFVAASEGETAAAKRARRLETLNQFTLAKWRAVVTSGPFELLEWKEEPATVAESLLREHPDVPGTLLDGVGTRDLVHGRIATWLRVRKP